MIRRQNYLPLNDKPLRWGTGSGARAAARFVRSSKTRPKDWIAWGGSGGVRVFSNVLSFEPMVVEEDATSLKFSGTTRSDPLRIVLYDTRTGGFDVDNLVQSYQLAFPEAEFKMPKWWSPQDSNKDENSLSTRMTSAITEGVENLYSPEHDVIQSLISTHGDYRIITSKRVVTPDNFVPHPSYGEARMAHALMDFTDSRLGVHPLPGARFEGQFSSRGQLPAASQTGFPNWPLKRGMGR